MTPTQYKAELLWIKVSIQEVISCLNAIQNRAIACWSSGEIGEHQIGNVEKTYPNMVRYPFIFVMDDSRGANNCFVFLDELRSYRARLASWFWNSRLGNPPIFSKEK
jgi:hypothetical protein